MKKHILYSLIIILSIGCSKSPLEPSGKQITENRTPGNFSSLHIEGANSLFINYGAEFKVELKGSDNLMEHYETKVVSGILQLGYNRSNITGDDIKVYITLPVISKVSGSGSSDIQISGQFPEQTSFKAEISGSGNIQVMNGFNVTEVEANISGSGNLDIRNVSAKKATVETSGSGNIWVKVEENLKVRISGSSKIYYLGDPVIDSHISGSGSLIRFNNFATRFEI